MNNILNLLVNKINKNYKFKNVDKKKFCFGNFLKNLIHFMFQLENNFN